MKKHLLFCLAFLAGLGMLLALTGFLFFPKEISAEAGLRFPSAYGYAAEPENSLDAVVIGDSLPLYGINPLVIFREQGIACYDCATPQQSLAKSRVFLTDILRRQSPKLVLLETDVLYRSMHRLEPLTELLSWRIPVFAFHDNWKTLSPAQLLRPIRWEQKSTFPPMPWKPPQAPTTWTGKTRTRPFPRTINGSCAGSGTPAVPGGFLWCWSVYPMPQAGLKSGTRR